MVFASWVHSQDGVSLHQLRWLCGYAIEGAVNVGCVWAVWAGRRVLEELHGMAVDSS